MSKHTSIVLPETALPAVDRVSKRAGKQSLRDQLKAGYEANAEESLEIALDWLAVDEEARQASPATRHQGRDRGQPPNSPKS
jgi:hypothetical protein